MHHKSRPSRDFTGFMFKDRRTEFSQIFKVSRKKVLLLTYRSQTGKKPPHSGLAWERLFPSFAQFSHSSGGNFTFWEAFWWDHHFGLKCKRNTWDRSQTPAPTSVFAFHHNLWFTQKTTAHLYSQIYPGIGYEAACVYSGMQETDSQSDTVLGDTLQIRTDKECLCAQGNPTAHMGSYRTHAWVLSNTLCYAIFMCSHLSSSPGCQKFREIANCHERKRSWIWMLSPSRTTLQVWGTGPWDHASEEHWLQWQLCQHSRRSKGHITPCDRLGYYYLLTRDLSLWRVTGHGPKCTSTTLKAPDNPALLQAACCQNKREHSEKAPDLSPISTSVRSCGINTKPGPRRWK